MAKHDHCSICDYTEANGAPHSGIKAGNHGRVRRTGDDLLCDACVRVITKTYTEMAEADENKE